MNSLIILALVLLLFPSATFSETIILRPVADTTLLESAPDFNMGGELHVASGTTGNMAEGTRNRALLKFDLSSIPAQSQLQSATLALQVVWIPGRDGGGGPVNSTFALHRVLLGWGEGTKLGFRGEFATVGEATWNHAASPRFGEGGLRWSSPGATGSADFVSEASATQFVSGVGGYTFGPTNRLIEAVKMWAENPPSNFGWLLVSQSESRLKTARRFASREDPKAAPQLTIEFMPPERPQITRVQRINNVLELQFTAEAGHAYALQFRNSLVQGNWLTLTNIPAPSAAANVVVSDSIAPLERFYRIARF